MERLVATVVLCLAITATVCHSQGIISGPLNAAVYASSSVVLTCQATPGDRVQWKEYATNPNGILVSDNDVLIPGHPNYARYRLDADLGGGSFNLTVTDTVVNDGGKYECFDENTITSRFAEVVIVSGTPNCTSELPAGGFVNEGVHYTIECSVYFGSSAQVWPVMVWSGPGTFNQLAANQTGSVLSGVGFDVQKIMDNQFFTCRTYFTESAFGGVDSAVNVPDFLNTYNSIRLFVRYGPENLSYSPVKASYEIGDVLTCLSDASPLPTYVWTDMIRTVDYVSQTFTITAAMVGEAVFRCEVSNLVSTANIFLNTTVNPITTPTTPTTTPTTTPVPAVSNCLDLTGRWEYVRSDSSKAVMCLYVDQTQGGFINGLFWNDTAVDTYYMDIVGRTRNKIYDETGLIGIWPLDNGVTALAIECHRCYGVETLLVSGISRATKNSEFCADESNVFNDDQNEYSRVDWAYPCGPTTTTQNLRAISKEAAAKRKKRMAISRYS